MKYQMSFRAKTRYPPGSPALHHHPSPLKFPISFQVPSNTDEITLWAKPFLLSVADGVSKL